MLSFILGDGIADHKIILTRVALLAALAALLVVLEIFRVIVFCKLFDKMYKPFFGGIIPFYRGFTIFRACRLVPLYFILLLLLPVFLITELLILTLGNSLPLVLSELILLLGITVILLAVSCRFAATFDYTPWFGVVLLLFPYIGLPILAFGGSVHFSRTKTLG